MTQNNKIPKLRFPDFSDQWETKTLGEVCSFFSGGTPLTSKKEYYKGGIPFIRSGEINSDKTELFISEEGLKKSSAKMIEIGDLIYALYGATSGEVGISKIKGAINQAILCIRTNMSTVFLMNYLKVQRKNILKIHLQGGQGNLSAQTIKSLTINLPSLTEQQKIADFFSLLDKRIENQRQKVKNAEQLLKGFSQQLFSQQLRFKDENGKEFPDWETKTLGEVGKAQGGFSFKSSLFKQGTTKVLRIGDIEPTIKLKEFKGIYSQEKPDKKYIVRRDDFLIALSGATFGKVGKISDEGEAYINQRVATFRTNQCLAFFYYLFSTNNFVNYIKYIPSGTAQPNISNNDILKYKTLIPSLAEQQKIASFLSLLDKKVENEKKLVKNLEQQKKYFLQNMFV